MRAPHRKTKAVFIDGPSASWISRALGVQYDFPRLREFVSSLGTCYLNRPPIFTVNSYNNSPWNGYAKLLREAGFEIVFANGKNEEDDREIRRRILELESCTREIVILSCDRGYSQVLRDRARRGVTVYWAATEKLHPTYRRSMVSLELKILWGTPQFRFIELANHLPMIT